MDKEWKPRANRKVGGACDRNGRTIVQLIAKRSEPPPPAACNLEPKHPMWQKGRHGRTGRTDAETMAPRNTLFQGPCVQRDLYGRTLSLRHQRQASAAGICQYSYPLSHLTGPILDCIGLASRGFGVEVSGLWR